MPVNVFGHNNGVIRNHADSQRQGCHGDNIEAQAQPPHDGDRGKKGDGNGESHDQGRSNQSEKEIEDQNLSDLMNNIEVPLITVLGNMEMEGIKVDKSALKYLSKTFKLELKSLEKERGRQFTDIARTIQYC